MAFWCNNCRQYDAAENLAWCSRCGAPRPKKPQSAATTVLLVLLAVVLIGFYMLGRFVVPRLR